MTQLSVTTSGDPVSQLRRRVSLAAIAREAGISYGRLWRATTGDAQLTPAEASRLRRALELAGKPTPAAAESQAVG